MESATSSGTNDVRRRRWRPSLAARLSLAYAAVFATSFAVVLLLLDRVVDATLEARDRAAIAGELHARADRYRDAGLEAVAAEGCSDRALFVRVSTTANRTLFLARDEGAPSPEAPTLGLDVDGREAVWGTIVARDRRAWTVAAIPIEPGRVLQVGLSDARRAELLRELRVALAWTLAAALGVALLAGAWLARRALAPVRWLASTTAAVVHGHDLSARVPLRRTGNELDWLSQLFNLMLARNEALVVGMRQALDNVAHDLRTPLTRLRSSAEIALRSDDPHAAPGALADAIEETDRVLTMLRTLMDVSEAEAGVMRLERERTDLASAAAEVRELYEHVADESGIELHVAGHPGAWASADRVRMRQAIGNLVDNALKYTPRGGRVDVEVRRLEDAIELVVRDTGMGIAAEDRERIWERLYRADRSRTQRGLGLGLSFVKAIVEAHGGTVAVDSETGRGARFTIRLPAALEG